MSCRRRLQMLISGAFRPFLFRESAKSRRSYPLRSAGIFPVLGQVMGQGARPHLRNCAGYKQRKGTECSKIRAKHGRTIAVNHSSSCLQIVFRSIWPVRSFSKLAQNRRLPFALIGTIGARKRKENLCSKVVGGLPQKLHRYKTQKKVPVILQPTESSPKGEQRQSEK